MTKLIISPKYSNSGIDIQYTKSRRVLYVSGWFDSFVGIEGEEFTLAEFFAKLGITPKDLKKTILEMETK